MRKIPSPSLNFLNDGLSRSQNLQFVLVTPHCIENLVHSRCVIDWNFETSARKGDAIGLTCTNPQYGIIYLEGRGLNNLAHTPSFGRCSGSTLGDPHDRATNDICALSKTLDILTQHPPLFPTSKHLGAAIHRSVRYWRESVAQGRLARPNKIA